MFVACGIWCLADVSSVSPSSEQTEVNFLPTVKAVIWVTETIQLFVYIANISTTFLYVQTLGR